MPRDARRHGFDNGLEGPPDFGVLRRRQARRARMVTEPGRPEVETTQHGKKTDIVNLRKTDGGQAGGRCG